MKKKNIIQKSVSKIAWLGCLNGLEDAAYLKLMYWVRMGGKLNLDAPKTFNEKLQWLKLHDRNRKYTIMVDKFDAKQYVANRIGTQYLIPTLGVWNTFDSIDFEALPNQFVIKCTHDSGGLAICEDKSQFDFKKAEEKINRSLRKNYYFQAREWPYKDVQPRIIAEEYLKELDCGEDNGMIDYKFYCFDGKPKFLYISQGLRDHRTARISFVTLEWEAAPFGRPDYQPFEKLPPRPTKFAEMCRIAEALSEGIPFVRVDLYQINECVKFSELTFSPCAGYMQFVPEEYDEIIGQYIDVI